MFGIKKSLICLIASMFLINTSTPVFAVNYKVSVTLLIVSDPLYADDLAQATEWCNLGIHDYKVAKGSKVKFLNETGKTVGLGRLNKVTVTEDDGEFYCSYSGKVSVGVAKFYSVEIDGRGGPDYSFSELKKKKWKILLTL
jgi:hypothetical protein